MCIDQKRYITKSHLVSLDHFQPGYITCDCGKCCECEQQRQNDYYIRSYYEAKNCIENGGFVLFDTLTYSDSNLPFISRVLAEYRSTDYFFDDIPSELDYTCFSKRDVQLFFKRLRKQLPDNSLRYFLAAEYGHEEDYYDDHGFLRHGTARPHYHVLFYVTAPIHPYKFSCMVADTWNLGRTDGVPYKGWFYVQNKRLFKCTPENYHFNNVINYFQKYTLKNGDFQSKINSRIFNLVKNDSDELSYYFNKMSKACIDSFGGDLEALHRYDETLYYHFPRQKYSRMKRCVSQFILSSKGYGASAFDDAQFVKDLDETGNVLIQKDKNTKVRLRCPSYYYRKRYYETFINEYGTRSWRLSQIGIDHCLSLFENRVQQKRYSLLAYSQMCGKNLEDSQLTELAEYLIVYRGSVGRALYRSSAMNDYLSRYFVNSSGNIVYNHNTYSAACHFGKRFVSASDCGVAGAWSPPDDGFDMISPTSFFESQCFFDDELEKILYDIGYIKNRYDRQKQKVYDFKKNLKEKFAF